VDFLHNTYLVISQARLPNYTYYSKMVLHLQAGPDNCHGRSAKQTGNINKPSFRGRLCFSLGC
jgi:hypothetical protein